MKDARRELDRAARGKRRKPEASAAVAQMEAQIEEVRMRCIHGLER